MSLKVSRADLERRPQSCDPRINLAFRFIENNLSEPELSVRQVAQHVRLTPQRLGQLLRDKSDITLRQYIILRRMIRAAELLKGQNLLVKEVQRSVGIASASSFSRTYKRMFGIPPEVDRLRRSVH